MTVETRPKQQLKAMIFEVTRQPDGAMVYKPVTSAVYLTVPMIAATLGICKQTVYREHEAGKLAGHRFGSTLRIALEDYQAWLDNAKIAEYERPMRLKKMKKGKPRLTRMGTDKE